MNLVRKLLSLCMIIVFACSALVFAESEEKIFFAAVNGETEELTIYKGEDELLTVNLQANFEITRSRVYVDEVLKDLFESVTYTLDVRDLGCGVYTLKIIAEDDSGAEYVDSITLNLFSKEEAVVFSEEYENIEKIDVGQTGTDILPQTDFSGGKIPAEMTQKAAGVTEIRQTEFTDGNALYIYKEKDTDSEGGVLVNIAPNNGGVIPEQYVVEYRVYPVNITNGTANLSINTPYNGAGLQISGKYFVVKTDGSTSFNLSDELEMRWYKIKMEVNDADKTYQVSIDGKKKSIMLNGQETYHIPFRKATASASDVRFTVDTNNTAEFYVDDVRIYYGEKKEDTYTNGMLSKGEVETVQMEEEYGQSLMLKDEAYVMFPVESQEDSIAFSSLLYKIGGNGLFLGCSDGSGLEEIANLSDCLPEQNRFYMLEAEIEKGECLLKIDGTEIASYPAPENFQYVYFQTGEGTNATIDHTVIHKFGIKQTNDAPQITSAPYTEDCTVALEELKALTVSAFDEDGISKIALYADSNLLCESETNELIYDLTQLGCGTHSIQLIATDVFGEVGSKIFSLTVTYGTVIPVLEENFASGSLSGTGLTSFSQRGYVKVEQVHERFGNSLVVGIESTPSSDSTSPPYVNFPLSSSYTNYTIDFDYYVSALSAPSISLRPVSGAETAIYMTENGYISVNGSNLGKYETGKWYHVSIDVDLVHSVYDLCFGNYTAENVPMKTIDTPLSYFRIYGAKNELKPGFAAVDNVKITTRLNVPEILSVEDENGNINEIDETAKKLYIQMSGSIYEKAFNVSNIRLQSMYGETVAVEDASFDKDTNRIIVVLAQALSSDTEYTIILRKDTALTDGVVFGTEVRHKFSTKPLRMAIEDAELMTLNSGTYAKLTMTNLSNEDMTVYVVLSVWNGSQYVSKQVTETVLSAEADGIEHEFFGPKLSAGQHAEVYVLNALCGGEALFTMAQ